MWHKIHAMPSKLLKKNNILARQWWCMPLIPALRDFFKIGFLSSLGACPGTLVDQVGLELKVIWGAGIKGMHHHHL